MIGTNLNSRYEVQKLIGEGATSTVYLGVDGVLGRQVALKVLHPHVRDTTRKRFFQEAMAAAQLNHPNIMAIHDRGEDNGRVYLVVEYVRGKPLSDFVPTDTDTVIKLGSQIAYALHYAHEREIIHRDIKPANIMVTPEGNIKIMDLGLALPREAKRVTAPGMVIGTPAYISPEQAQGSKDLDKRTDVYSLGIILYELLTGQVPFQADTPYAIVHGHIYTEPELPSKVNPDLTPAIDAVLKRALEKDRENRYPTALAVYQDALWVTDIARDGLPVYSFYDEINRIDLTQEAIPHFGFPHCIGADNTPDFAGDFDCSTVTAPTFTLQTHSSPMDLSTYDYDLFPRLQNSLIVVLMGSNNTQYIAGHALLSIELREDDVLYEILAPVDAVGMGRWRWEQDDGYDILLSHAEFVNNQAGGIWGHYPYAVAPSPEGWLYFSVSGIGMLVFRPHTR